MDTNHTKAWYILFLLGAHVSVAGGLHKAFNIAEELKCEAIQIFTRNQLQWHGKKIEPEEAETFSKAQSKSGVLKVFSHASYLINLSGRKEIREKSELALIQEINRCSALGISEVVLHPGYALKLTKKAAIQKIAESLQRVLDKTADKNVAILLETTSGQGSVIGSKFSELAEIHKLLSNSERIAFCIDTCHIFAAGYDIRTENGYHLITAQLIEELGLKNIKCWHLNDSLEALGSNKDRHANLGEGSIGHIPFKLLVNDKRFFHAPGIIETPKKKNGDVKNLSFLRSYMINNKNLQAN